MSLSQVFRDLRALLTEERAWTKFAFARNEIGKSIRVSDPEACSWCLIGGLEKVCGGQTKYYWDARAVLIGLIGRQVSDFNDDQFVTHTHVINLLDEAAECVH